MPKRARATAVASKAAESQPRPSAVFAATPIDVYRSSCLECHDNDGRGSVVRDVYPRIPDFTDPDWHSTRSDDQLSRSILEGKGKSMPRMKEKLGSLDVKQMVAFLRGFRSGTQVVDDEPDAAPTPELPADDRAANAARSRSPELPALPPRNQHHRDGSQLFQRFCLMCHGPDGKGGNIRAHLPTLPDFTRPAWQAGRSDHQLLVSVLDGKGAKMPSFAGRLSREQARDVVAFIRTFAPVPTRRASADMEDFEARFQQLSDEFEHLGRQIRALSSPKP
jgi:cytochrome c oxidase cbb3-type subunit 3